MFLHLSVILFTGGGGCLSRHPLGRHPRADTPPGRAPAPKTATAADGAHPTGMHSSKLILRMQSLFSQLETRPTLVKIY